MINLKRFYRSVSDLRRIMKNGVQNFRTTNSENLRVRPELFLGLLFLTNGFLEKLSKLLSCNLALRQL